jgi:hypothetical protein
MKFHKTNIHRKLAPTIARYVMNDQYEDEQLVRQRKKRILK